MKDKEDPPRKEIQIKVIAWRPSNPSDVAYENEDLCRHGVVGYWSSGAENVEFFFSPPSALKKIRAKPLRLVRGLWFFWISAHRINIQMNCSNYIYSNYIYIYDIYMIYIYIYDIYIYIYIMISKKHVCQKHFFVFDFLTMIVNCCLLFDDLLTDFSLRKGEGCFWPLSRTWQEPKFTSEETKELMTKPAPWQSQ